MVKDKPETGMTLIEVLMVVVIVGVLATLGLVNYSGIRERSMSREATANLRLVAAAERVYRMETGSFYAPTVAGVEDRMAAINTVLRLSLPTGTMNWEYDVLAANADTFTAEARRHDGTCIWQVTQGNVEPGAVAGTNCPQ
ncbi:MAG: prepilin-type N-terminal cleavage/methylation domain-containing protein [Candidatus Omnitrophica bacterium]|nr:prepilin-type N-terminal cleavage/methylation domain-containing protein [Candidatus Omnitrophota bacterium]